MKNIQRAIGGVICCVLLLTSCGRNRDVLREESFVYCLNEESTGLVKVSFEFSQDDTLDAVSSILDKLKEPARSIEYIPPIPDQVEVREYLLKGSILNLDFSRSYAEMDPISEKLTRAALVRSLVQINGVNAVSFTIEGEPFLDASGHTVGLMNEDDFVENTGPSLDAYQTDTFTLYFADKSGSRLVAQKTEVRHSSNVPKEKLIVEKLMKGPSQNGGYPAINPDANLLSVTIKDGICYVNFDSTFLTGAYDVLPEVTVYSIVNSLIEGTEARMVQITINGETDAKYMESVDLAQPLEKNNELIAADK